MSVALPETDGRVLTTAVGFKETQATHPELEFQAKGVEPDTAQIQFVAELAAHNRTGLWHGESKAQWHPGFRSS
jgi:cobalamin biosynthesis Mg chelatase CobN